MTDAESAEVSVNSGFWDLSAEERAAAYEHAEQLGGRDFLDLSPEERAAAYEWAAGQRDCE